MFRTTTPGSIYLSSPDSLLDHIPTEFTALGQTFDAHWNVHALLMVFAWIILVPLCITIMHFHKPPPSEKGIQRDVKLLHPEWWFLIVHKFGLIFAMILALGSGALALFASGGLSGSIHSYFGWLGLHAIRYAGAFDGFLGASLAWCGAWVIYAYKERAYGGYRVAHGYGLEHPYNMELELL